MPFEDGDHIAATNGGVPVAFTTDSSHRDGYTVGAGIEYMFAPNWSAKIEYQYYNFGSGTFLTGPVDLAGSPFHRRRTYGEGRHELSLQLGWPGRRAVLITIDRDFGRVGLAPTLLFWPPKIA